MKTRPPKVRPAPYLGGDAHSNSNPFCNLILAGKRALSFLPNALNPIGKSLTVVRLVHARDPLSSALTHLHCLLLVIVNPGELLADGVNVTYGNYEASHAVFYQIWSSAVRRSDHGQARHHRFDDVAAKPFDNRWEDVRVASSHNLAKLLPR